LQGACLDPCHTDYTDPATTTILIGWQHSI